MRNAVSALYALPMIIALSACGSKDAAQAAPKPAAKAPPAAQKQLAEKAAPKAQEPQRSGEQTTSYFEASVTAAPARSSPLAAKGAGILLSLKARVGDRVKRGETICQLDPSDIELHVEQAKVGVSLAEEAVSNAEADLKRAEALAEGGALPPQGLEKAQLGARMAKLQLEQAKVGLRSARQALADMTLKAPFDGVITQVMAEEGQYITSMPPSPIAVLVDTSTLELKVPIPERVLSQVKEGMEVTILIPTLGVERSAKVHRLAGVVDAMSRSAEAVVRLDNKENMPAGLFARVLFPGVVEAGQLELGASAEGRK